MNDLKIVVDTSVFFSLLVRRDAARRRAFLTDHTRVCYGPRFLLVEL